VGGLLAAVLLPSLAAGATGARLLANEDLLFFEPQPSDHFGGAMATGDFNGDGADDLATGIPFDDGFVGFEKPDVGAVIVRYGAPKTGFPAGLADAILNQLAGGSLDPGEPDDRFGSALAACDFNGDGYDDLAVGVPGEDGADDDDGVESGAVDIFYGGSGGLETVAEQHLTQDTPGIPGAREVGDLFGFALACGDIDGDGFSDLAIGAPGERFEDLLSSRRDAGTVDIVPGSSGGLDASQASFVNEDSLPRMNAVAEPYDNFGYSLAIADFDHDRFADLFVGAPGEDNDDDSLASGEGVVIALWSSSSGFTDNSIFDESYFGEVAEAGDRFATALAAGDFDHDGFVDVAIGTPHETFGDTGPPPHFLLGDAGSVAVLYGQHGGLPRTPQLFTRASVVGGNLTGDLFGFALATGDLDGDGFDDLAIGQPGEAVGGPGDGAVTVVMGATGGLDPARYRELAEGVDGLPGSAIMHDLAFGEALACGDFDGDGNADLTVGIPDQDGEGGSNVGAAMVLYGGLLADGFETGASDLWSGTDP